MSESPTPSAWEQLDPRRQRFIDAYLGEANYNQTKAAAIAGYSARGARSRGCELLKDPLVKAALTDRLDELAMPAKEILARLTEQARASYADFTDDEGLFDLAKLKKAGLMRLVKKISWDKAGNRVVEFHDVQAALVHIGRHHALFTEKHEHSGPAGGPIPITEVIVRMPADEPDDEPAIDAAGPLGA